MGSGSRPLPIGVVACLPCSDSRVVAYNPPSVRFAIKRLVSATKRENTMHRIEWLVAATTVCLLLASAVAAPAPSGTYTDGQKVEVREGDAWSAATIVQREGRRYLIHYEGADAADDEWVAVDRIRPAGAKPGEAKANPPAKPAPPKWAVGNEIEAKWGGTYRKARIVNSRGDWYLVQWDNGPFKEWVEPWRIRKVGSKEDNIGYARPNPVVRANEPPPRDRPGDAPESPSKVARPGAGAVNPVKEDPAYKAADWDGAVSIDSQGPGAWELTADPALPQAARLPSRTINLRGGGDEFLDEVKAVALARANPTLAFVCHLIHKDKLVKVERIDLATGASAAVYTMSPSTVLVDASPDGKSLLMRSDEFGFGKQDWLEIWTLQGPAMKKSLVFFPYDQGDWTKRDVSQAMFVDGTHFLTVGRDGRLAVWDAATGKAVYTANVNAGCSPSLSPTGKYLAIHVGQQVLILQAATGKVLAELPLPSSGGAILAFSPTGRQLAAWAGRVMHIWDLTTGKLTREFSLPKVVAGSALGIVADGYGLLDGKYLVDFDRRIVLWNYASTRSAGEIHPGGKHLYAVKDRRNAASLVSVTLPHPAALVAAKGLDADQLLLLKPGVKVSLDMNIGAAPDEMQQITAALKERIQANGLVFADNQPIRFVTTLEQGKSEEREYRTIGGGFGGSQKITVTQQIVKISLQVDGQPAWEASSVTQAGSFLSMKQGQTLQDAINDASKPNYSFLKTVRLPQYLVKPREPAWYGTSNLTATGITGG